MAFGLNTNTLGAVSAPDWLNDQTPTGLETTFGDDIEITLKAGLYGMANNFIQIGNFFGSDAEEYNLYEEMGSLGNAYLSHKEGYDIAGDIITSFIPGGIGLKAIKLAKLGKLGSAASKVTGFSQKLIATDKELKLAYKASGNTVGKINELKRKAFTYSVAEQAVEGAIIGGFVDASMHLGEILNDDGLSTIGKVGKFVGNVAFWSVVPAPIFAPISYLTHTKGSRDFLKNLNQAKTQHTYQPYAASSINEIKVTPGSKIAHTLDQIDIIDKRPIVTGTLAEESYKTQADKLAKLDLADSIKEFVAGANKVAKEDESVIGRLTDLAYSKLGTPEIEEVKNLFYKGKKFELGGAPTYSPKFKKMLNANKDKISYVKGEDIGHTRRFFKDDKGKLFINEDSSYLRDMDKSLLHYFGDGYQTTKVAVKDELNELIKTGDLESGLDSFTSLQKAFNIFESEEAIKKANTIINKKYDSKFETTFPKLTSLFKEEDSAYVYGKDRIKYADLDTGRIIELPIKHLGDLSPYIEKDKIRISKGTGNQRGGKVYTKDGDIKKVDDPLEYQAKRVLASYSPDDNVKTILSLDELAPEQAYSLESSILSQMKDVKNKSVLDEFNVGVIGNVKAAEVFEAIRKTKAKEADRLLKSGLSSDEVVNTLGVTDKFIIARGQKDQLSSIDFIKDPKKLETPKHAKITMDTDLPTTEAVSIEASLDSMRGSQFRFLKQVGDHIADTDLSKALSKVNITDEVQELGISRMFQDAVTHGGFKSLNLATATIGHVKNNLADQLFDGKILPELSRLSQIVLDSNESSGSLLAFRNWYDRQGSKFVKIEGTEGSWLDRSLYNDYLNKKELGLSTSEILEGLNKGSDYYTITDGNVATYVDTIQDFNRDYIHGKQITIEQAYGNNVINNLDNLYMPPRNYPHVKYVRVTNNIYDAHSEQVYRIIGKDENDLAEKVLQAEMLGKEKGQTWTILTQDELSKHATASKAYDWSGKNLNLGTAVSSAERKGARQDLTPESNATDLINETISWFKRKNDLMFSAAVELHHADFIADLTSTIRNEKANLELTTTGGRLRNKQERLIGTYEQLYAQMLGYDKSTFGIYKQVNNSVEIYGSKILTAINKARKGLINSTPFGGIDKLKYDDVVKQNELMVQELKDNGIDVVSDIAIKDFLAQQARVSPSDVRQIVSGFNQVASTLMIKLDPADSLMNALGLATKLSTEVQFLNDLVKDDVLAKAQMDEVFVKHFGAGTTQAGKYELNLTSVAKAMANAPTKLLSDEGREKLLRWRRSGLAVDDLKLVSDMFQESRVRQFSLGSKHEINTYKKSLLNGVKKSVHLLSKPHRMTNNYTQFVVLDFAEDIGKAAGLRDAELYQFMFRMSRSANAISTHVTKPRAFQGSVGLAVSLYQSYAFHTTAQLLKYAASNKKGPLVTYAMLNGAFFGAQSVPGFQFINQHIGRDPVTGHADFYTGSYTTLPKSAADFLMYGAGGSLLQSNLSVRGNVTPRHLTVLPTQLKDLPAVTAMSNLVGAVYDNTSKLLKGDQNITQAALNTVIDSHLNRPLVGLASNILGKTSDSRHSAISIHEETFGLSNGLRVIGLKPLKEQIVTDYFWRSHSYQLADRARQNNLSETVKLRYDANPDEFNDPAVLGNLADQYVRSGGKLAGFDRWLENSITKGTTPLEKRIEDNISGYLPYARNFNALTK